MYVYSHVEREIYKIWKGCSGADCQIYIFSVCVRERERFTRSSSVFSSPRSIPVFADHCNAPTNSRIATDVMARLMEGDGYGVMGNGGVVELDGKVLQTFQKSFAQVQHILDQNRVLINEINQNQESHIPDNLSKNVGLITELNNNIRKVADLYSYLSSNLSKPMDVHSSEGDSRLDSKGLRRRSRPPA